MFKAIITATATVLFLSCSNHIDDKWLPKTPAKTIVLLQPFPGISQQLLNMLKDSIPNYYPISIQVGQTANLPAFAYYQPRNRYKADSILIVLERNRNEHVRIVAGITEQDISVKKGNIDDYGIMGYGYSPGYVCIVSTFRLNKDGVSQKVFEQRLLKTVVHELGHNFGLPHCPNPHCLMADAKGKLAQDNEIGLCVICKSNLHLK